MKCKLFHAPVNNLIIPCPAEQEFREFHGVFYLLLAKKTSQVSGWSINTEQGQKNQVNQSAPPFGRGIDLCHASRGSEMAFLPKFPACIEE